MRALYDQITAEGWPSLLALRGAQESPHLEAKEKEDRSTDILSPGDEARIAAAVCGLANADGGVFLFGVRARTQDDVDRSQNIESISRVAKCLARVEKAIARTSDPPITRIEIEKVEDPTSRGAGVVVLYVGSSDGGPHRVGVGRDEGRYYLRAGSRTVIMPHTILADRFGRRPPAKLRIGVSYGDNEEEPGFHEATFYLQNHGRSAARQPAILIHEAPGALEWEAKEWGRSAWTRIGQVGTAVSTDAGWRASADVIIFPGQRVTVATFGAPPREHAAAAATPGRFLSPLRRRALRMVGHCRVQQARCLRSATDGAALTRRLTASRRLPGPYLAGSIGGTNSKRPGPMGWSNTGS